MFAFPDEYETDRQRRAYAIESSVELWVERQFNRLDARLMRGELDQATYDLAAFAITEQAQERLHKALDAAGF